MPKSQQKIKINVSLEDIEELNIQEASKFLLRCMYKLCENKDYIVYKDLLEFMKNNYTNYSYYKGNGINSVKNINNYWYYINSNTHSARIPNFYTLVELII
tara:strand:+ start:304 stop:606 length:303 start_codon:yes stop_codon:yes gene_type:complete